MVQEGKEMNHVKAMTYAPKVAGVRDGTIRQTIRIGSKVSVGDTILFHGWKGRPYVTKWSWRMRVTVTKTISIRAYETGFLMKGAYYSWRSCTADTLARLDGVPSGEELGKLLTEMHGLGNVQGTMMQVIRW